MVSITSRVMTVRVVMLCTSTSGDVAATVMVSSTAPTFRSALTVAVGMRSQAGRSALPEDGERFAVDLKHVRDALTELHDADPRG